MSAKSKFVRKARFRVVWTNSLINTAWRDYFRRSFTYMVACEEAERLRGEYSSAHAFKVLHEDLAGKEK